MLIPAGRKKIARLLQKYTQDVINLSNKKIQLVIFFGNWLKKEVNHMS